MSTDSAMRRVQRLFDVFKTLEGEGGADFMNSFLPHVTLVSATDDLQSHHRHPHATFAYTVQPGHCNRMHNMHGGAIATLFDEVTSIAQVLAFEMPVESAAPGDDAYPEEEGGESSGNPLSLSDSEAASWTSVGVSRTLAVTYLRPAPAGEDLLVECEIVHRGKRMASLRGVMRRKRDNKVVATCEHGKFIPELDSKL